MFSGFISDGQFWEKNIFPVFVWKLYSFIEPTYKMFSKKIFVDNINICVVN
jgi:hypothetical protein